MVCFVLVVIFKSFNPYHCGKPIIAKMDKMKLDTDSYRKNIDKSIGVIRIDKKYYFLAKSAIQNYWLIQNESYPYIKIIFK